MKIQYIRILTITVSMISVISCSSTQYLSQPTTTTFAIDGERNEWDGRFETPENEKFAVGVGHDDSYLYLAFISMDPSFKRSVLGGGYTIWLDVKGGKKEDLGLKFKSNMANRARGPQNTNRVKHDEEGNRLKPPLPDIDPNMELIVVEEGNERLGPADLIASNYLDENELFIEVQIPMNLLGELDLNTELGVGFESNLQAMRPDSRPRSGGVSGGMQGGRQGGRSGGRKGGQSGRPNQSMVSEEIKTWLKVQFAGDTTG